MSSENLAIAADRSYPAEVMRPFVLTENAKLLFVYGYAHLVVDAVCAATVFVIAGSQMLSPAYYIGLLLLFHVLAFGLQSLIGLGVDLINAPRAATVLGCLICSVALLMTSLPTTAIILAGLGNAIFHVGGGIVSLRIARGGATAPGLYVAPGSLGLLLGAILGRYGLSASLPLLPITLLITASIIAMRIPTKELQPAYEHSRPRINHGEWIIGLILLSIAVRALLGFVVVFPWESHPVSLVVLTLTTCFGKAVGGILADRWGWVRVAVGALLLALPLIVLDSTHLAIVIPGMFLLNLTMPITLAAVARALPGYPGFAFGLTCLALLLGALPPMLGFSAAGPVFVASVIITSVAVLYCGLRLLLAADTSFPLFSRARQ